VIRIITMSFFVGSEGADTSAIMRTVAPSYPQDAGEMLGRCIAHELAGLRVHPVDCAGRKLVHRHLQYFNLGTFAWDMGGHIFQEAFPAERYRSGIIWLQRFPPLGMTATLTAWPYRAPITSCPNLAALFPANADPGLARLVLDQTGNRSVAELLPVESLRGY
jgi:hypothetical protein